MVYPELPTAASVGEWLEKKHIAYEILGRNFVDQPIYLVKKAGVGRPVLLTAGAHAGEPSGVIALLLLLEEIAIPNPIYAVPLRDPFGWEGYGPCLRRMTAADTAFRDHETLDTVLRKQASSVLFAEDGFLMVDIAGVVFVNMHPSPNPTGPREVEKKVNTVFQSRPELAASLRGRRLLFPSNAGSAEGVHNFDRAFSAVVSSSGLVADFNRQFGGEEEPLEVRLLREFTDELRPALTLDLHEGQGDTFYLFVPDYHNNPISRDLAGVVRDTVQSLGTSMYTLTELAKALGPFVLEMLAEPEPGVLVGKVENKKMSGTSFGGYAGRYGSSLTFETGRWAALDDRVQRQVVCGRAVLQKFASHF